MVLIAAAVRPRALNVLLRALAKAAARHHKTPRTAARAAPLVRAGPPDRLRLPREY